ncbi:MAG: hypothetical protein ACE5LV_10575, partial [Candidatus Aminicenantales bacterium]
LFSPEDEKKRRVGFPFLLEKPGRLVFVHFQDVQKAEDDPVLRQFFNLKTFVSDLFLGKFRG